MAKRILYFDVDGTILLLAKGIPKPALQGGAFEEAVRSTGFSQVICVGNVVNIVHELQHLGKAVDGSDIVFDLCQGIFRDKKWLKEVLSLVSNPEHRVRDIDLS